MWDSTPRLILYLQLLQLLCVFIRVCVCVCVCVFCFLFSVSCLRVHSCTIANLEGGGLQAARQRCWLLKEAQRQLGSAAGNATGYSWLGSVVQKNKYSNQQPNTDASVFVLL